MPVDAALGLGLLWRPRLAEFTEGEVNARRLGFVEVIAESVGHWPVPGLAALRDAGATLVPHGVSLGLGGASRPDSARLARLAQVAEWCSTPVASEHLAFVRAEGIEAGHLLPIPRTREMLDIVVDNVRETISALPSGLALEPIASLLDWPDPELSELAFLSEILERTDADLVLDVANIHVNTANRRWAGMTGPDTDPLALIDGLPADRIAYVHAAGGRVTDGRHHDTHTDPLWPEVEALVEELWARHEVPGLLLERDGQFPPDDELRGELGRLEAATERGRARRTPAPTSTNGANGTNGEAGRTPSTPAARQKVSAAQSAFLHALTADVDPLPGFDPADLDAVSDVLIQKRASAVRSAVPDVAAMRAFTDRFTMWAREHPLTHVCGTCDAASFVRSLPPTDRTPAACVATVRAELASGWPQLRLCRSANRITVGLRLGSRAWVKPWRWATRQSQVW